DEVARAASLGGKPANSAGRPVANRDGCAWSLDRDADRQHARAPLRRGAAGSGSGNGSRPGPAGQLETTGSQIGCQRGAWSASRRSRTSEFVFKSWRRERDSNPRRLITSAVFKTAAINRTRPSLRLALSEFTGVPPASCETPCDAGWDSAKRR